MTTPTSDLPAVTMDGSYAADLADLLHGLSQWVDTEEHQLRPLLDRHDYDIDGLRVSLDLYAALLTPHTDDEPAF